MDVGDLLVILGLWVSILLTTEMVAKKEEKEQFLSFIQMDNLQLFDFPSLYVRSIDRLFGEFWSIRRLLLSWIFSIITVLIISFYVYIFKNPHTIFVELISPKLGIYFIFIVIIVNCIPDYFSLQETMWILHARDIRSMKFLALILFIDALLTAVIFVILSGSIIYFVFENPYSSLLEFLREYLYECMPFSGVASIFFISTFFTSIWLYFLLVSITISHSINKSKFLIIFLQYIRIKKDRYPFLYYAAFILVLATVVYILSLLINYYW